MSGVDDRIVSMKFDNAAFERRLSDTITSLDKLRLSLDFANSTKGFEHITAAANSVNLGTIASATDHIAGRFNAMAAVATAAIMRITNMALDAGMRFAKSFTVAPIMDGFREMETKVGSIQTILANTASKGTTLPEVEAALEELNHYADKTIYNFGEMTKNIGLFTNAGIGIEDATAMIKGFSNSAAASGTNAQQAAGAAYQLSQALSAGTIRLMDWRSLTNAGMGNKNMQNGIIEIAEAMGTLDQAGISSEEIQGNFNASLEKNWLSADVMTKYLKIMAGEMSEAEMATMGLTKAQVDNFMKQQKTAEDAATKVRTFTQLIGTAKENIGSGWAQTFELILGNFDQATELFTDINNSVSGFIDKVTKARNDLLQGWADFGGRTALIEGLKNVFGALGDIMTSVGNAFRSIFPPTTSADLLGMTARFVDFSVALRELVDKWLPKLTTIFKGVFAVAEIVWTVIKGVVGIFWDLVTVVAGLVGGPGSGFFLELAKGAIKLNRILVEGGGIADFFQKISGYIKNAGDYIRDFKDAIVGLFSGFSGSEAVSEGAGKVTEKLGLLAGAAEFVREAFDRVKDRFVNIGDTLHDVGQKIGEFIGGLGQWLADLIQPADFDKAVDAVNVGLLGGIMLAIRKFVNGGLKIDFGNGLLDRIGTTFDTLTQTMKNMQAELKAKALVKIATAIGILTASVIALSLIDSADLTKALLAMSVGFGQLVGVMVLMDKASMTMNPMKMNGFATSMVIMATAMGVLSMAVTNLSQLSWVELAKGLGGVAISMGLMIVSMKAMTTDTAGLVKSSIAITAIATAMLILSQAVTAFSGMSWGEMGQGLLGIAGGLMVINASMNAMPVASTLAAGAAMIPLATGLVILAEAVQAFADISWGDMGKGLLGITGMLMILSAAMNEMPINLPITAAGLVILSGALVIMAQAVEAMGSIKMGDMAKGIGGLAAMLMILDAAMQTMNNAVLGAAALVIVSGALVVLSGVLKILGGMSLAEIGKGLLAMAGTFVILGAAGAVLGPLAPALMAVGTAMALVGGGFALFGAGAFMIAKAFEAMAESGVAGAKAFVAASEVMVGAIPRIIGAIIKSIAQLAKDITALIPMAIEIFRKLLGSILDTVIEMAPKIGEALGALITTGLTLIREQVPAMLIVGFEILSALLRGIGDNIAAITTTVIEIFAAFSVAVMENMATIVAAGAGIILSFLAELGAHAAEFIGAGLDLIINLALGITNNIARIVTAITTVIGSILLEIAQSLFKLTAHGLMILEAFIRGVIDNIGKVVTMVVTVVTKMIDTLTANANRIVEAGFKLLTDLLSGIANNIIEVAKTVGDIASEFVTEMAAAANQFIDAGFQALKDFLQGIGDNLGEILETAKSVTLQFLDDLADESIDFVNKAAAVLLAFLAGLETAIRQNAQPIRDQALAIVDAIIDGIVGGFSAKSVVDKIYNAASDLVGNAVQAAKDKLWIFSPSRVFRDIGEMTALGFAIGIEQNNMLPARKAEDMADNVVDIFKNSLSKVADTVSSIDNINPVIAPVLDLTKVREQARGLNGLVDISPKIVPELSYERAREIATTTEMAREAAAAAPQDPAYSGPTEVKYEQNIFSPTALSTNDIYRNTKSLITITKEELEIA